MSVVDRELKALRSMFYLLHPNETYFKELDQVPDFTAQAGNMFIGLMLVEQVIYLLRYGRFNGRMSDAITSMSAGIIHALPAVLTRQLHIISYDWIYKNYMIYELPWDSVWTYIVTFLFVDMMYYWFHRAAHEVNLFWAAHQTHHSSEDYNLSTALRQSIFQKYTSWFFYLPLAFFVNTPIYLVHTHLNLIYQFWIHTEMVNSIGPLEYILNTASHHRVHHGRNPYCIDKNYAGVLIIWDRMFGTFAAEKENEELAYGLVHPVDTFDPFYIQIFNYQYLFGKFLSTESWSDKFSVLFKGPGWVPGTARLGNSEDLPKIQYPIVKKGTPVPHLLNIYVLVNFLFVFVAFFEFIKDYQGYPSIVLSFTIFGIMYSLTCFGKFFDNNKNAVYFDLVRCSIAMAACVYSKPLIKNLLLHSEEVFQLFFGISSLSFVIMLAMSGRQLFSKNEPVADLKKDVNNNDIIKAKGKAVKCE